MTGNRSDEADRLREIGAQPEYELEPDRAADLRGAARLAAHIVATVYIGFIAAVAGATGLFYIMFPELGALSFDVLGRPGGRWAKSPIHVAFTPVLTAIVGIAITRTLPYGKISVLMSVGLALAIIAATGSPVAPAISAGLLPLVLGVKSWGYPPGILFGTAMLATMSIPWRSFHRNGAEPVADRNRADAPDAAPPGFAWLAALFGFIAFATAIAEVTGMRYVMFPPLAVIAYEMFGHASSCEWADKPIRLPVACVITAAGGFLFWRMFGVSALTAVCAMAWGIAVLRTMKIHVPPALAVALLPMVMDSPTALYPVAVGVGTFALTGWFYAYSVAIGRYALRENRIRG